MVFIIAELGTNHMGDVKIAKKLIDVAVSAGCNAVKLQKKNVEKIYTKEFLDSPIESPWGTTQRDMRLHRELNDKQFRQIDLHCKRKKIPWFVSCWDVESQIHMRKFRTKFNKIASAMLVHEKLLHTIAEEKKYTFISTGMSSLKDIEKAVKIFRKYHCPFELLHCHSAYPMPTEEANVNMIPTLKKKFKCKVGYSGHENGIAISIIVIISMNIATDVSNGNFFGSPELGNDEKFLGVGAQGPLEEFVIDHDSNQDLRTESEKIQNIKPDIYYIIPDEYPSNYALKQFFGFDNIEFLTFLETNDFHVVNNSFSNYPSTIQSLTSSLNMEYLDTITEGVDADSKNYHLLK